MTTHFFGVLPRKRLFAIQSLDIEDSNLCFAQSFAWCRGLRPFGYFVAKTKYRGRCLGLNDANCVIFAKK